MLEALFPIHGSEMYFTLYGRRGFHEYQVLVPFGEAAAFVEEARRRAARRGVAVALCSAKAFEGAGDFLRFDGDGIAVAFDFPRGNAGTRFMEDLDAMTIAVRGKPNIVKDSRLPAAVVRACYPDFDRFRTALHRFDPKRRIRSTLSERLGL